MKIKFWGTRGSIPAPGKDTTIYGGNTTCLEMTLESGRKVIVDAGTGIRALGDKLTAKDEPVDVHLLVTHIHWDHVLGFPFFAPIYDPTTKISVDGFPACMKGLRYLFDNKIGDGFFPLEFDALKAEITYTGTLSNGPLQIDSTLIETIPLQHPQGGFGFRFREGTKTLVFITDNELTEVSWPERGPGDYVHFCKEADILIHDAQYTPEEIGRHRGWGHSDYIASCKLAIEAGVERLILFHHDPSRKDSELPVIRDRAETFSRKNGADLVIEVAREGTELRL